MVVVVHYLGLLKGRGLEWIVYVADASLFPMLYFAYIP